jgi:hypothetical protein
MAFMLGNYFIKAIPINSTILIGLANHVANSVSHVFGCKIFLHNHTENNWAAYVQFLLHWTAPKSAKKYGNCGHKFIFALVQSIALTVPIFMKLTRPYLPCVEMLLTNFAQLGLDTWKNASKEIYDFK